MTQSHPRSATLLAFLVGSASLLLPAVAQEDGGAQPDPAGRGTAAAIESAAELAGLTFTGDEIELMLDEVRGRLGDYEALRGVELDNGVPLATSFSPWAGGMAGGMAPGDSQEGLGPPSLPSVQRPANLEDVCYWTLPELAALLRQGDVSSVELTEMYLSRLERLDASLHCAITILRDSALKAAAERDTELADDGPRSIVHGIPWGVKDLMAVKGHRTTWGAKPFEHQVIDQTAEVVARLDQAGAVLIAKLSVGALAWGDVWFGEKTRSPWDVSRGSSGSSAGSASATAAGCVAFALGTETLGSIVSPSVACSTSALRPTFGRVSRDGVMALSWTMDKVGPITRTVGDAAIVFDVIKGRDAKDPFSRDGRVPVEGRLDVTKRGLRIGVPKGAFRGASGLAEIQAELEALGAELVPIELPEYPVGAMLITLSAEAATAFDELTRSGKDDELVRQVKNAWPNTFRAARLIPAVEYLRAQRLRALLMRDMDQALSGVDALVHAPYAAGILSITNLTGHPAVVAPFVPEAGPKRDGSPYTVSFTGHVDRDEELLAIVAAWQSANPRHVLHPGSIGDDPPQPGSESGSASESGSPKEGESGK